MSLEQARDFVKKKMGEDHYRDPREGHKVLPTGFYSLDNVLDGGFRTGTYIELFGPEAAGKSFLAVQAAKQGLEVLQKPVLYMDFEHAWNPERAEALGLDMDFVVYSTPATQENGYDLLKEEIKSNMYSVIIVDSLSAMLPESEDEKEMAQQHMALSARGNSKGLRMVTPGLSDTIVIFINQVRESLAMFGDPLTTSGGRSVGHYCHHRLKVTPVKPQEKKEIQFYDQATGGMKKRKVEPGHVMRIQIAKSRFSTPHRVCDLFYSYDLNDVDKMSDLISLLTTKGLIQTNGPSVRLSGVEKAFKGKKRLREYLENNPSEVDRLVVEANQLKESGDSQESEENPADNGGATESMDEQS